MIVGWIFYSAGISVIGWLILSINDRLYYRTPAETLSDESHMVALAMALIFSAWFFRRLTTTHYLNVLSKHADWVVANGLFDFGMMFKRQPGGKLTSKKLFKGKAPSTYSVADELIKWSELHSKGVISDEEFQEAKSKLMKN